MLLLQWNARPIVALRARALLQSNAFAIDVDFEFLLSNDINGGEL